MCGQACSDNIFFYECMIYEYSLNPEATRKRYTYFNDKDFDWMFKHSLLRLSKFIKADTFFRLKSGGSHQMTGPTVCIDKKVYHKLRRLYAREDT